MFFPYGRFPHSKNSIFILDYIRNVYISPHASLAASTTPSRALSSFQEISVGRKSITTRISSHPSIGIADSLLVAVRGHSAAPSFSRGYVDPGSSPSQWQRPACSGGATLWPRGIAPDQDCRPRTRACSDPY